MSTHYDPLMAKLIVWGRDRREAICRMAGALAEFSVSGVRTTIPFHRAVMRHPDFVAGWLSTAFVERLGGELLPPPDPASRRVAIVAALPSREPDPADLPDAQTVPVGDGGPARCPALRPAAGMRFAVTLDPVPVEVVEAKGRYRVRVGDEWLEMDAELPASGPASLLIGSQSYRADVAEENGVVVVTVGAETYRLQVEEAGRRRLGGCRAGSGGAGQRLVAPMPGRVVAVHVRAGDRVDADAPLVVLEAMKMENEFRATAGGVVTEVAVAAGQAVNAGDLLVVVGPDGT